MARRRRGAGIAGLQKNKAKRNNFSAVGAAANETKMAVMAEQLETFKANLEAFAEKHRRDIKRNPAFRRHFQRMCAEIGVDPLASRKGFWAELLGFGDFYYELAVQVTEVCMATRSTNGGLIEMDTLRERIDAMRGSNAQDVSEDDVERAINSLGVLGAGFAVLKLGSRKLVQSVPCELNRDHSDVLLIANTAGGHTTVSSIVDELMWTPDRARTVLDLLQREGMAWVDEQADEDTFWFPSLCPDLLS